MEQRKPSRSVIRWATIVSLVCAVPVSASGPDRFGDGNAVVSPALELAAALNLRDDFLAGTRLVDDAALVAVVRRVGRRVAEQSDRPDLPYAFYVLESGDEPADYQAISLPGGTIGLTRALAELLVPDEDGLAFALAHEVVHVALRHHLSGTELLHDGSAAAIRFADRLQRHHEFEADRYGALYLVRAGFRYSAAGRALSRIAAVVDEHSLDLRRHPSYEQRLQSLHAFRPELERSVKAFDRAAELMRDGEIDEALTALSVFVQQFPQSVAGRVNLGTACLIKLARESGSPGGLDEPLPFLETSGIEVRGVYDGELLDRARRNFQQALAVQPASWDALLGLALIELREGNTQASEDFLARTGAAGSSPKVLLARGNTRYLDDEPERAVELYLQALALRQGWPAARKNLALAYESIGRHDRAARAWHELLEEPRLRDQARWQLFLLEQRDDY